MGVEIERRFLAKGDAWRPLVRESHRIEQGYLIANKELSIRTRLKTDPEGEVQSTLTIKSFISDTRRSEYEYEIPVEDARAMMERFSAFVVRKTRHLVEVDGDVFEIDEYEDKNSELVLVELEMEDERRAHARPEWLGEEVTSDGRYSNAYLSHRPYNDWRPEERTVIPDSGGSL